MPRPGCTATDTRKCCASWCCAGRTERRSIAARRLDGGDVDLLHRHHRLECALGDRRVGAEDRFAQRNWGALPGDAPLVLAPAALAFLAAVVDDRVPVAISLLLVGGRDLEREGLVVLERRSAIEPEAGDAEHGEVDRKDIALFPGRIVARREVHRADR